MRVALVQQKATEDLEANRRKGLEAVREAAGNGADVVCFAELAFEPFYPQRHATPETLGRAEPIPGAVTNAFSALARELGVVLVLNLFERDGDKTFDTSPVIDADGTILGLTRMVHITAYEGFPCGGHLRCIPFSRTRGVVSVGRPTVCEEPRNRRCPHWAFTRWEISAAYSARNKVAVLAPAERFPVTNPYHETFTTADLRTSGLQPCRLRSGRHG